MADVIFDEKNTDIVDKCKALIKEYDFVLFGIGKEFFVDEAGVMLQNENVTELINVFMAHVNYFIISTTEYDYFRKSQLNQKRISCPFCRDNAQLEDKQWELYNKWLSGTMGRKLLIIELGENFDKPNVIKWPFERITMINNSAKLYRINSRFYQVPPEISDKSVSVKADAFDFFKKLFSF
ncbi:MAG: hypothetical protein ACI4E1_07690 [Lachnospira sp.]